MSKKDAPGTAPSTKSGGVAAFVRSRRGLLVLAAVALVSVAAAAFVFSGLVDGDESASAKAAATASKTNDATSTPESGAATAAPLPPSARPRPDGTPPDGARTPDGRQGAPSKGRAPVPLAPAGSELTSVTSAPPKTLNRVKMPEGVKNAKYAVSFEPYGWAPASPDGRRMVVMISSSKSKSEAMPDITGKNLLLAMASYGGEPLNVGGKFEGTVEVRADSEGRGAFYLIDSQPAR